MSAREVILAVTFLAAGGAVAWAYCGLVWFGVRCHPSVRGGSAGGGHSKFFALMLIRVALIAAGFYGAVQCGSWAIITYIVGFYVVRTVIIARAPQGEPGAVAPKDDASERDS